jgi:hypothetical protein
MVELLSTALVGPIATRLQGFAAVGLPAILVPADEEMNF